MLETAVVEATLHRALAAGGDFADVFVEDRAVTSATYDDRKVEEMRSGRSRGAGIRVVKGETTGFAHTTDLTAWYATDFTLTAVILVAVVAGCTYTSLAGQRVFKGGLLRD